MPDKLFLCKPCIEKMKGFRTVERVVSYSHVKDKGACDQCGKRRYGYMCGVEFKEAMK